MWYSSAGAGGAPPHHRPHKLHIIRFLAGSKAHSFRCSSSPHRNRFAGFRRGPRWCCRIALSGVLREPENQTETCRIFTRADPCAAERLALSDQKNTLLDQTDRVLAFPEDWMAAQPTVPDGSENHPCTTERLVFRIFAIRLLSNPMVFSRNAVAFFSTICPSARPSVRPSARPRARL